MARPLGVVLAIDPGTRYVGLAISNPEATLAFPLEVVAAEAQLVPRIARLVEERAVARLIVGRPLSLRGTVLPMTPVAEQLAEQLKTSLKLPVDLVDERLSTREASERTSKKRVDAAAAALILQTYLERHLPRKQQAAE
ncbi:MAG: Holliday junction resolvase RuvX [Candidatus Andersenbacteria bacterium]